MTTALRPCTGRDRRVLKRSGWASCSGSTDWHFEILGLVSHAHSLQRDCGTGPATVSLARLESAPGSNFSEHAPHAVTDAEFLRLISILRLALPEAGQISAHEEPARVRAEALRLGITEMSAGARCEPGAYASGALDAQVQLGDHRPLDAALLELLQLDFTRRSDRARPWRRTGGSGDVAGVSARLCLPRHPKPRVRPSSPGVSPPSPGTNPGAPRPSSARCAKACATWRFRAPAAYPGV